MNTNKQSHLHRTPFCRRPVVIATFFAIMIIVALITILIFCFALPNSSTQNATTESSSDYSSDSSDELDSSSSSQDTDRSWDNTPVQYEGEDANDSASLTGYVTYTSINQGVLYIGTVIDQYFTSNGSCVLLLRNSQGIEVFQDTVDAFGDVSASACDTFSIPLTNFSSGTYRIIITLSGDNKNGTIIDEVTI